MVEKVVIMTEKVKMVLMELLQKEEKVVLFQMQIKVVKAIT